MLKYFLCFLQIMSTPANEGAENMGGSRLDSQRVRMRLGENQGLWEPTATCTRANFVPKLSLIRAIWRVMYERHMFWLGLALSLPGEVY